MLALVTDAFGGRGGIAQYNRDFINAVSACGVCVDVLPRHAPYPINDLPEGVVQRQAPSGRFAYSAAALGAALRNRPDIIFCGHLHLGPLAACLARLTGAKLLLQLHGIEVWKKPPGFRCAGVRAADLALCVSQYTREQVLGWADMDSTHIAVLPNTVREIFTPGDRSAARRRFGFNRETVLLSVGRIDSRERYKGHDRIIELLPTLVKQRSDVAYLIAGDGDDRPRLEKLAAERGIESHVRFIGVVDDSDLPDLYRAADLFALPSTGEGFGIVYLEAMACGTPAIGLNVGGAPEALGGGSLGTVSSLREFPNELAAALNRARSMSNFDRDTLSERVLARFGRRTFRNRVSNLIG